MNELTLYPPPGRHSWEEPTKRDRTAMVLYRQAGTLPPFTLGKRGAARWAGVERAVLKDSKDRLCIADIVEELPASRALEADKRPGLLELVYRSFAPGICSVAIDLTRVGDSETLLSGQELSDLVEGLVGLRRSVRIYKGNGKPTFHPGTGAHRVRSEPLRDRALAWASRTYGDFDQSLLLFGSESTTFRDVVLARSVCELLRDEGYSQSATVEYLTVYGFSNPSGNVGAWSPALVKSLLESSHE